MYDIQGTPSILAVLPAGSAPAGVAVEPDGKRLFVTNGSSNNISVYDLQGTPTVLPTLPAGSNPFGIAVAVVHTPTPTPCRNNQNNQGNQRNQNNQGNQGNGGGNCNRQ